MQHAGKAGLSIAEFLSKCDLVQVVANSRCVGPGIDRQHVLQQAGCQVIGHQRGPAGLQVEQLRGDMLGKQPSQRAEGLAPCWLAGAAVKAWADQGNGAERSAEQKAAASFALKVPTTLLAVSMPRQETRRRNEAYLRTGQHGLGLVKRQADLLELVIALVEAGDHVIAEHVFIIADDPDLDLNSHGLSQGSMADKLQPTCLPQRRPRHPHRFLCSRFGQLFHAVDPASDLAMAA